MILREGSKISLLSYDLLRANFLLILFLILQVRNVYSEPAIVPLESQAHFSPFVPNAPATDTQQPSADFVLLVEQLSAEWESRLVPPLLHNLQRLAPYTAVLTDPNEAVRSVANSSQKLALLRRSSAFAAGVKTDKTTVELLEVGPASCVVLVVRKDAVWQNYADLNYGHEHPLRVEAVSPNALADFKYLLSAFPLNGEISLVARPTHIAVQRLIDSESDLVVLDVPRRGSSQQPEDVMTFVLTRELRLLDPPHSMPAENTGGHIPGEVIMSRGWFFTAPKVYSSLCDPFVLALPTAGSDHLIYALYSALAAGDNNGQENSKAAANIPNVSSVKPAENVPKPSFWNSLRDAWHRLLIVGESH